MIMVFSNVLFPSIRQTTLASSIPKSSSQTVPQSPRNLISTLPELASPPVNLIPEIYLVKIFSSLFFRMQRQVTR